MKIQFLLKNTGMYERLGIMTLSSVLKKKGHDVRLNLTEEAGEKRIVKHVTDYKPDVLAYSVMTGEHIYHIELNQMVKSHYNNAISVFGGPHPTYCPEMIEKDGVDAICRGEGEIYFPELVEKLEQGQDYYDIKNFWFKKKDGSIVKNKMGKLIPELDSNPEPDRKLMYDADNALRVRGTKLFMATRGCPYQCTYCFNHAYNALTKGTGEMIRTRSVDSIIQEIKEVQKNYFMDRVNIDDDIFLLKPKGWLEEFAEKFPREIGLPLYCNIRPELVNEKTGYLLKKIGCLRAAMGIECGNNEVARKVLKRNTTNEKIVDAVRILKKNDVKIKIHNIIGLPVKDPLKVDFETLDFNIKLKPHVAGCSILYPYPGTEVSHLAKEMGMFDGDHEKVQISNKSSSNMQFGSKKEQRMINNFHKLFPIIVEWPFLRFSMNFLIKLPLSYFYTWIFFAFYGYKYIVQSSFKGIVKNIFHYMIFYFKYVSRIEKKVKFKTSPKKTNLNIEKEQKHYVH